MTDEPLTDENANERYERRAEQFYKDTGYMAPGKSMPMEMANSRNTYEAREAAWGVWCKMTATLAERDKRIAGLEANLASLEGCEVAMTQEEFAKWNEEYGLGVINRRGKK